ncbi:hypothetical protein [Modestobacter sp. SYSU DS0511]
MSDADPVPTGAGRSRGAVVAAVVVAALVVAAVVLALTSGGGGGPAPAASPSTPSATPTSAAATDTPEPGAATTEPSAPAEPAEPAAPVDGVPATVAPVALDEEATSGDGVVATLSAIEAVEASGTGPGNIAGPALRVTVRIANRTDDAISLDGVEVTLTHTAEELPGSPVDDAAVSPLRGQLAAGSSAEGTYVFSVPADQREVVRVLVGHSAGAPLLVFAGAV